MAGRGPAPKNPKLRQRKNRSASAALISADGAPMDPPKLPNAMRGHAWHARTRAWWNRLWKSPMASQWLASDVDGLFRLAILVDDYWKVESGARTAISKEIRMIEQKYGLTPDDRRRLNWEVVPPFGDSKKEQTNETRNQQKAMPIDPRIAARREAASNV